MIDRLKRIDLSKAVFRFPLASLFCIIATAIVIYFIQTEAEPSDFIFKSFSSIYIAFLLSIIVKIASESYGWTTLILNISRAAIFLLIPAIYCLLTPVNFQNDSPSVFRFPFQLFAVVLILHLLISYVPFIFQSNQEDFWEYNKDIFLRFVESAFFAGFSFVGLAIALTAINHLFNLDIDGKFYGYLLVSLGGIFHSLYFLSKFPTVFYDNKLKEPIKPFLIFSQYILIPIVLVYLGILYAYGAQIAIKWELPKGWVSQLTLWFSIAGIFTYLLNYFNHKFSDFAFSRYFKKYFFIVLLIPILLLFIAIYRRISDYGVTEERYIVALLAVWLLITAMYFNFSKKKQLKYIPISLTFAAIFSICSGPLNMFNSTLKSQIPKIKQQFSNSNVLADNRLMPFTDQEIKTPEDYSRSDSIRSAIHFIDRRTDLSFINNWIEEKIDFIDENTTDTISRSINSNLLFDKLNIKYSDPVPYRKGTKYFNAGIKEKQSIELNDAKKIMFFNENNISKDRNSIELKTEGEIITSISIREFAKQLYDVSNPVSQDSMTFYFEQDSLQGFLLFDYIHGRHQGQHENYVMGVSGIAVINKQIATK